jgi:hypothetical protein
MHGVSTEPALTGAPFLALVTVLSVLAKGRRDFLGSSKVTGVGVAHSRLNVGKLPLLNFHEAAEGLLNERIPVPSSSLH